MRTLDAIATEAARADYSVTLLPVRDPTLGQVSGAYSRLSEAAVDGVDHHLRGAPARRARSSPCRPACPVVVIDSNAGDEYTVVDTDQADGARQATAHLLDLGHRQVWHIAGPECSFSAVRRADSWASTLRERRHHAAAGARTATGPTESGYRHGLDLGRREDVTAIFAANDQMALGSMRALHELGRDVPGDISVVGFDDMEEAHSLLAAADHGPPGLRRGRPAGHTEAARQGARRTGEEHEDHRADAADRAWEHRPAEGEEVTESYVPSALCFLDAEVITVASRASTTLAVSGLPRITSQGKPCSP